MGNKPSVENKFAKLIGTKYAVGVNSGNRSTIVEKRSSIAPGSMKNNNRSFQDSFQWGHKGGLIVCSDY